MPRYDKIDLRGAAEAILVLGPLSLPLISATSPTLAETMRLCHLRAGISRAAGSSAFVVGNPKAWLGTAYHEVLENISGVNSSNENIDGAIEILWTQAVARQHQRAKLHALDQRFGLPPSWPGYYVVRASVFLRARELVAPADIRSSHIGTSKGFTREDASIREQKFTAFNGRLVGKPDVIRTSEIIDYKSGSIIEFDEITQADVVKAAYIRQLRIYGFLVKEALGWWPQRGLLLPSAGAGVEVGLQPDDCAREATEAVAILDEYNARLGSSEAPDELAMPSPSNCKWCPFKLVCIPFWKAATAMWSGQLDGAAVEGVLDEQPRAIQAGAAFAVSLQAQAGSETLGQKQIAPLSPNVHPNVPTLTAGDQVRFVGLRVRPDGTLVPTQRTVVARISDLPKVALPTEAK